MAILYLQGLEGLQDGTSLSYSPDVHVRSVANEEEGPKANKAATKQSSAGRGILRGDSAQQENATKSSETAVADADMQAWQSKLSFMRQQVKDLPWIAEMVRTFQRWHTADYTAPCKHAQAALIPLTLPCANSLHRKFVTPHVFT